MLHRAWRLASPVVAVVVLAAGASGVARGSTVKLNGQTFTLPDGFTIELVAGPPAVDRPIMADFDEQGRLYVSDSSGSSEEVHKQLEKKPHRVLRLEDTKGDGHFDRSTVFADHLMFPEGAMWFEGSFYVSAPPSIWKLTDTTGGGTADRRVEWFEGKTLTGCANDLHGPYLGPDGWIYWCKGAFAEQRYERPGKKPFVTRAAHIFRARPDGSGVEPVMTGGMDNPVHVVFTADGERLFTTTFLQEPAGGHRDGIIHAIYGGIYGKVNDVTDDHPHTSPELMPVLVHLGPAAACGLLRYHSKVLGPEYQDNLFATCFNLHKVTRHVLHERGATYDAGSEDFLVSHSLDFHPTDVIDDADGSLLVVDTGGWYKLCCPTSQLGKPDVLGAIYRVRRVAAQPVDDPRGLKIEWAKLATTEMADLLSDARPAVAKRAMAELARRADAPKVLATKLAEASSPEMRERAYWVLTRIADPAARALVRDGLKDPNPHVRQVAAHSASLWRDGAAVHGLVELLNGENVANRRVAAEALGRIGNREAVPNLLAAIAAEPDDRVLDHSLTYALIEIADPAGTRAGLASDNPRVRRAAMMALDQMDGGGLDAGPVVEAVNAPDAPLRETAAWIAGRHPEWGDALASALRRRIAAPAASEQDRTELEERLARLAGSPAIQKMLASIVSDPAGNTPEVHIAAAAMGRARLKHAPAEWVNAVETALEAKDVERLKVAVAAAGKLTPDASAEAGLREKLLAVANRDSIPADVRLRALEAVRGDKIPVGPALFRVLLESAGESASSADRLAAAQVLARSTLSGEQLLAVCDVLKSATPLQVNPLLAAFAQSTDPTVGRKLAESLAGAKALASLRPDSVRDRLAAFGPELKPQADALLARLNPDAAQQKTRLDQLQASLPKGDVRRGQLLFNNAKTACASCHAIGYVGGHVGPDLTRVGAIRSERDLLESVVYPSASFVQSFEPTMVITRSGDRQYGIVRGNDAQGVLLVTGPNAEVRIPRDQIQEMRPGTVSLMPAGFGELLSPQELGDLLSFLKACR